MNNSNGFPATTNDHHTMAGRRQAVEVVLALAAQLRALRTAAGDVGPGDPIYEVIIDADTELRRWKHEYGLFDLRGACPVPS